MKNRNRLTFAVAAMIVSLQIYGPAGAAAPTQDQLAQIETLIASGDYEALAAFLAQFPELMQASTPFAQELRSFFEAYSANPSFAFSPSTLAALQTSLSTASFSASTAQGGGGSSLY